MKHSDYNTRIAVTIKAMRKLRCLSQNEVADSLFMDRSAYAKLEKGFTRIHVDCLKSISGILNTSVYQIHAIAEADILINFKFTPLSVILIKYTLLLEGKAESIQLNPHELEFIFSKIKSYYEILKST
ncbi:MAG: helix-turn-helix transcriptional regulator [Bacteroidia bacterium]|jgi:transcriptional regulator with XRE-family HTH domain|nr:helix-turn-helix transcriptional regulator [Bacteroidia bacterium]